MCLILRDLPIIFGIFRIGGHLPPTWSPRGTSTPRATKTLILGFKVHFRLLYLQTLEFLKSEVSDLRYDLCEDLMLPDYLGPHNLAEMYIL